MNGLNVAIVGATGAVGQEFLNVLAKRNFPLKSLRPLASERSAGKVVSINGDNLPIEVLSENSFNGIDLALFSAGSDVSKRFAPIAVNAGALVVDNSSAFRMVEDVPLIVPEVNGDAARNNKGIIANPNCSTIQMVVALKPIYNLSRIKRIIVSTYQSVSGTGQKAINELMEQTKSIVNGKTAKIDVYPYQIAFNVIPQIDVATESGFTKEEIKMIDETRKILDDKDISIGATAVRVPVMRGHSESIYVETEKELDIINIRSAFASAEGLLLEDNIFESIYPTPLGIEGKDLCYVGRLRKDLTEKNGIHLWVVADNLLKGAALNAVQIAELVFY